MSYPSRIQLAAKFLVVCGALSCSARAHSQWECGDTLYPLPFTPQLGVAGGFDVDLDGDGVPESIINTYLSLAIVRDWNGDGVLDSYVPVSPAGTVISGIDHVAADCDGDGDLDVATLGAGTFPQNSVSYYRNDGGTLVGAAVYAAAHPTTRINAGDLDGDGLADLVVGARVPSMIQIFRGTPTVPLQPVNISAPAPVIGTEIGDFDGDGDIDIVAVCVPVSSGPSVVVQYLNTGGLQFTTQTIATGNYPGLIGGGDFDSDGDRDVCLAGANPGWSLAVLRAGPGGLAVSEFLPSSTVIEALEVSDLDFDGRPDIVSGGGSVGDGILEVRRALANGTLGSATLHDVPIAVDRMALVDVDKDGAQDAIILDSAVSMDGHIVLKGRPSAGFASHTRVTVTFNVADYQAADMDGDLDDDLVVAATGSQNGVRVFRCDGEGGYALAQFVPLPIVTSSATLICEDLDADGDRDVAVAWFGADRIDVLRNDGAAGLVALSPVTGVNLNHPMRVGDVNGDGLADLVVDATSAPFVRVHLNQGAATFGAALVQPNISATNRDLRLGDVDGDGTTDLVAYGLTIGWHPGVGAGVFGPRRDVAGTPAGNNIRLDDIDQDGDLDIISLQVFPEWVIDDRLGIQINNGAGEFEFSAPFPITTGAGDFEIADIDGNGVKDLLLLNSNLPGVAITLDFGSGSFGKVTTYTLTSSKSDVRLGHADMDGRVDLMACPGNRQRITVARSQLCPIQVVTGDLNGDGTVGGADLGMLLSKWGYRGLGEPADLDGDGLVGGSDLGILLAAWAP